MFALFSSVAAMLGSPGQAGLSCLRSLAPGYGRVARPTIARPTPSLTPSPCTDVGKAGEMGQLDPT